MLDIDSRPPPRPRRIPNDVRDLVAFIVHKVHASQQDGGPTHWFVNAAGLVVLEMLGIPARIEVGAMLYRCGPDPLDGVLAFCGPGNVGTVRTGPDGPTIARTAHVWIRSGDFLIDFSPVQWRSEAERMHPHVQWTTQSLPTYVWKLANQAKGAWRSYGSPDLGEVWYGPMKSEIGIGRANELLAVREWIERALRDNAEFAELFAEAKRRIRGDI